MITIFETLSASGLERTHSEFIRFLFSEESFLSNLEKNQIIESLLGQKSQFKKFEAITEHKKIDLILIADEHAFIIENKIKNYISSAQLAKYHKEIESEDEVLGFPVRSKHYVLLSLVSPTFPNETWVTRSYQDLHDSLTKIAHGTSNTHPEIFAQYIEAIRKLCTITKEFCEDHQQYPSAYEHSQLTKGKLYRARKDATLNSHELYINKLGLHTILQKAFLTLIAAKMKIEEEHEVHETRGRGLLDIFLKKVTFDKVEVTVGIQFQYDSIKLTFNTRDPKIPLPKPAKEILDNQIKGTNGFSRLNQNKNPNKKNYRSVSKTLPEKPWNLSAREILSIYSSEYETAKDIAAGIA